MKKSIAFFMLLLTMFTSCEKEMLDGSQNETNTERIGDADWKSQLNAIKEKPNELLLASGISLVDYQFVDVIDNIQKLDMYRALIKEEEGMLPYYNQSLDTIKILTRKEAIKTRTSYQEFTLDKLNKYVDESVLENMKIFRLTWDYNGTIINTFCVISDEQGIVYDCFITNTLVFKIESNLLNEYTEIPDTRALVPLTGTKTWTEGTTADWIWGSERGYARVSHIGYYRAGTIYDHDYRAEYYFQFGNAIAKATKTGNFTIAYVYAMATTGVTINTGLGSNGYYLSFSSYIPGTTSGSSGSHSFFNDYTPVMPAPEPIP